MTYEKELEKRCEELQRKLSSARSQISRLQGYGKLRIPTLDKNWYDRDHVLLHVVFTVLVEFIEKEWKGVPDVLSDDEIAALSKSEQEILVKEKLEKLELFELYKWWTEFYPKTLDDPRWHIDGYETETNKAMRVVALRKYLWT